MTVVRRLLVFLGAVHVAQAVAAAWLWRHRRAVVVALAEALAEDLERRRVDRERLRERAAEFDRQAIAAMRERAARERRDRC
jgi:hypothetical protein